jgi:elongation factor Tu
MSHNLYTTLIACFATVLLVAAMSTNAEMRKDSFRMTVLDAFKITGKGVVLTGQVEQGAAEVGDWVCVPMRNGETVGRQITGLETFRKVLERIEAGDNGGVLVDSLDHKKIAKNTALVAGCITPATRSEAE